MLHRKDIFEVCEQLAHQGFLKSYEVGDTVGRGFADIGFEEFTVLPNNKLVSRLTGQTSEIGERDVGHLFLVPTPDQIIALLSETDTKISSASYPDSRRWEIVCRSGVDVDEEIKISKSSLHLALLTALSHALSSVPKLQTKPRLRVETASA